MNKKKIDLQMFAGITGSADVQVKAREIDFVSSFGKDMKALLDVMGITRMIKKENGSVLKTKKATGTLESGAVAEGEEIPLSQYKVEETVFDSIRIEKYRKAVSVEAIADKGYDAAVQMTDDEFRADLQNKVTDRFYAMLKKGSLTGHEATWQMAVAMAIGKVKNKFQSMKRSTTGVAVWVNTVDAYKYLGDKAVTLESTFGVDYLKNFLGADVLFLSSEVPENTVIATPLNNIVAYYVDPANSDFAKAGLAYTTDAETGFIGFHTEGTYGRAISDMFAIMGVRLFAEHLDAIAHIAVGEADTQTLGTLTLTSTAGDSGKSVVTVAPQVSGLGHMYKYKTAAGATSVTYGMDVKNWAKWDGKTQIEATGGHHITVVECTPDYKAVASGDVVAKVGA